MSLEKNVLGCIIKNLIQNKDIQLYEGGNYLKDYMYVEDVCKAIYLILTQGNVNEIYNISSGSSRSFRKIIEDAKSIVKSTSNLIDVPIPKEQRYIQVKNMTLNNEKLMSLGFSPSVSFDKGLKDLCYNLIDR